MPDLSLYIHVPFCRRKCGYCSFISYTNHENDIPAYVDTLCREVQLTRRPDAGVKTIYFGGGTPSLLPISGIERILNVIREDYRIDPSTEVTFEANPGTIDEGYLKSLKAAGVNRLSLGIQSLDDGDIAFFGRLHSVATAIRSVEQARAAGFDNLSLDFIYGLPGRPLSNWAVMLDDIINLGADHLSLYGLTLETGTPMGDAAACGEFVPAGEDEVAAEYEMASQKLEAAGYRHYEISNWARPGFESRHNALYWKRGEYLGLGAAAHSFIDGRRLSNTGNLGEYINAVTSGNRPPQEIEVIDEVTALAEAIFLGLRLEEGISPDDIGRQFSIDLHSRFAAEIAELSGLGLIESAPDRLRLTPRGRLLGNEVFLRFLPS